MSYLSNVSHDRVLQGLLSSLASWTERNPGTTLVPYNNVVGGLVVALRGTVDLADEPSAVRDLAGLQGGYKDNGRLEHPDNEVILAGIWRLVGLGVVYPRLREYRDGYPNIVENVVLTPAGVRMVANLSTHPAAPTFSSRMRTECPGIPDDPLFRIEDAVSCLFHHLLRPAVVMLGLAYEEVCQDIGQELVNRTRIASVGRNQRGRRPSRERLV